MRKHLLIATRMTAVTIVLLGILYPLLVTGLARVFFPKERAGSLITSNGEIVGSRLIGQKFSSAGYFHPRPSAAGTNGYDATNSGGSNLGPTNRTLIARVESEVQKLQAENPGKPVPAELVTASGSGLDPHISPAAAEFQVPRVARERGMTESEVRSMVERHTEGRQLGFLGEPRVNVLELNLDLDARHPMR